MKNRKVILIVIGVLLVLTSISLFSILRSKNMNHITNTNPRVRIKKSEIASITYKDYNNDLVSMKIPKGWKVETTSNDYIHYGFMVYNPKNTAYKIFVNLKIEGFLRKQEFKDFYYKYYGTKTAMGVLPVMDPPTVEHLYKNLTESLNYYKDNYHFEIPVINNFKVIESLGPNNTGGEILRAVYKDENNRVIDGVFTTTISEIPLYYMTGENVYNTIFFTAPKTELTNWFDVLNYCVSTIEFSPIFINEYNSDESIILTKFTVNEKAFKDYCELVEKRWKERQETYDINEQKSLDKKFGLERVYNRDTKKVYRAKAGFIESYEGVEYDLISDEMYNLPVNGLIK